MVSTTMVSVSPGLQEAAGLHGFVKAVEGLSGSQRVWGGKGENPRPSIYSSTCGQDMLVQ